MLSVKSRPYIDASVPVLREHGLTITKTFYKNLFNSHPELHNIFNAGNQANGTQQQSLASAVFAYAANIDNADALSPVISRIVHKHASLGITAAHYPIVGEHLLGAIKEVLGDAATPELLAAWAEAYGLLAKALSDEEARMYKAAGINAGDLFELRVTAIDLQSTQVKSFVLSPVDGSAAPAFHPGQYMSVAIDLPDGLRQLRQYSLSDAPDARHVRISVKREIAGKETPAGMVSNWLHDNLQVGSTLKASKPFGDFQPDVEGCDPIVLLSAGVGVTPMVSVLNRIAQIAPQRHVIFAHAARNSAHHPHQEDVKKAMTRMPNLQTAYFYEEEHEGQDKGSYELGRMKVASLPKWDKNQAKVYMCGPLPFMQQQWTELIAHDVPPQALHREVFGPDMLDHLI